MSSNKKNDMFKKGNITEEKFDKHGGWEKL